MSQRLLFLLVGPALALVLVLAGLRIPSFAVRSHMLRHEGLWPWQLDVLDLTPPEWLPAGSQSFYVEQDGCIHCPENQTLYWINGQLFPLGQPETLGKLLKHLRFLETRSLSVEQLIGLFMSLGGAVQDPGLPILDLAQYSADYDRALPPEVTAPDLRFTDGGAELIFWVHFVGGPYQRNTLTLHSDYTYETTFELVPEP